MEHKEISNQTSDKDKIKQEKEQEIEDEEEYDINITSNSNYEEVSKFLIEKLHISQEIIDLLNLDGEILFNLEYDDIDALIEDKKAIKSLKKFIDKRKKIINDKNNKLNNNKKLLNNENENNINKEEYIIESLNDKSKFNVFILISLKKNSYNNIKISFSCKKYKKTFNDLQYRILNVINEHNDNQNISELFLIQIELGDFMEQLDITIINENKKSNGILDIKDINNYFNFNNFSFDETSTIDKILYNITKDTMFTEYFNYFFDKKLNYEEQFNKDLIYSLLLNDTDILLSGNNILKIFKYCQKYKFELNKEITYIKFNVDINSYIEQENILLYSEIDNLLSNSTAIKLILHIYIIQLKEKEILNDIINKSKYQKEFSKALLSLLKDKIITPKDLFFFQKFNLENVQSFLIEQILKKVEINYIIEISQNLEKALEFISRYYLQLYKKVKSLSSFFEKEFKIDLSNLEIGDNFQTILELLKEIFKISNNNSCHLINYEILFKSLDKKFFDKDIEIYSKLNDYITLTENYLNKQIIKDFNDKFHNKGMDMIKNNQIKDEKIFLFMTKMDKYYFSQTFKKSEKKDPEIMKYIPLTDVEPNYLKNIEWMKKYEIINCFLESKMENKFYEIILKQVNKISDFKFIFEIFSFKLINEKFTNMINTKLTQIKYTILDINDEKYVDVFDIFDNLLFLNKDNIGKIIPEIFLNLKISNQYCIYLLNKKTEIEESIIFPVITSTISLDKEYPDLLINILLNSKDKYTKYILEKINKLCIDENDFFKTEKNSRFILYSTFITKYKIIYKNYEDMKGTYPNSIKLINDKILNNLENGNIKFKILRTAILNDKEFENKIKLIIPEENKAQLLYEQLKNIFEQCQKDFKNIEIILEYYSTFFSNSKEDLIKILEKKEKEYKEDINICELINIDIQNFLNIKNFYLNEAIEETKNIKYKYSSYFMIIYKNHYEKDKSEKSEDKILTESINDYINTFKEIIEKLELKLSLYEINNIDIIMEESRNPEFNLDIEIDFIKQEFSFLYKSEYIEKNLKNDLIQFIEQFHFVKLIQGIIEFIKYNYLVNENKESYCFDNLRKIYGAIISKQLNEENINEYINLLKLNENFINSDNILIKFYTILLEKKESLAFLKNIEDSFKNKNGNIFFNSNEMNNLLNIYAFYKKLLKNEEIKTDKDFYKIYNDEIEKNNNIKNALNELYNKYNNFTEKKIESKEKRNKINENINNENSLLIQFSYNCNPVLIQGNMKEKMKNIIDKFIVKTSANRNSIYFIYGGNIIQEEKFLFEIINNGDKLRNQMNILVNSLSDDQHNHNQTNSIINSKEVICPKCSCHINMKIENYKISLFDCKNNHSIKDIFIKDFQDTQNIDLKKINCDICNQRNKHDAFNNEFFICFTCSKNLCPICKSIHDKSHFIINYDKKNSICEIHFESYNSYCKICKKNLCMKCEKEHLNHEKIYFGNILPDIDENKKGIKELEKSIKQLNININEIIEKLKSFKENINSYYKIYNNIMKNIDSQNRNFEILNNIIEINNNDILKDIKNILDENNIKNKFNLILDIVDKNKIFDDDEITLIYKINNNEKEIKIFDSTFVQNNKSICKIKYNNKETELKEFLNIDSNSEKLKIKLKGIKNITNASKMFYNCKNLISLPDIIKWNLFNLIDKNEMFKGCNESLIIPEF